MRMNIGLNDNEHSQSFDKSVKSPLYITEKALARIKYLMTLKKDVSNLIGIRIFVEQKGCFGLKYKIEYAYEIRPLETSITKCYDGVKFLILIDPKAALFIIGTSMDYVEDKLSSGFVFYNPNEKGRCGCGESFYV